MYLFTFFVKKIAIKRAIPLHAKLRDTTLIEVVLHGYGISDVHGSAIIDFSTSMVKVVCFNQYRKEKGAEESASMKQPMKRDLMSALSFYRRVAVYDFMAAEFALALLASCLLWLL